MKKNNYIVIVGTFICVMALCTVLTVSCSKDGDTVNPIFADPCSILKARYNSVDVTMSDCSSYSGHNSNVVFNEYGQVMSFNFTASCGSKQYSGSVYNITYNSAGDVSSYNATVNGQNCHWQE
jgi:hypothetical protein